MNNFVDKVDNSPENQGFFLNFPWISPIFICLQFEIVFLFVYIIYFLYVYLFYDIRAHIFDKLFAGSVTDGINRL